MNLPTTGPYVYAQDETTDIWMGAWAFDDEEPALWFPGQPVPQRIVDHINAGGEVRAHNAQFERLIWWYIATPRYGWPAVKLEQFVCSAAEAAAMSLPRSLGECARVTGVAIQKDTDGYALMMRMCRPRKINEDGTLVWWDVPDRVKRLGDYCITDVKTERALAKVLRRLNGVEREVYLEDQRINDRGLRVDHDLVLAAKDVAGVGIARANARLTELTQGEVSEVTNHRRLTAWLQSEGVETDSVSKAAVRDMLIGELKPKVREALTVRADAGRSSIAKLESLMDVSCADQRVRGLLLYHGAGPGRWTGRLVQPQNFPRGEVDDIESFIPDVLARDYDRIDLIAHPIVVLSSMLRSMLTAAPGHDLIAGDYSAIEARVLNWLAGQDDILALFAAGEDVYRYNAAKLYKMPLAAVQKFPHRQTGKFQELGCGYGMGDKKAVTAAKDVYGLILTPDEAKVIVKSYRETHPHVVAYWRDAEDAAIAAVTKPGEMQVIGPNKNVKMLKAGPYLYVALPSGRCICYPAPKIMDAETPWGEIKPQVEISSVSSYTRQWGRSRLYGGLIVENIVQGVARDLMAWGMLRAARRGYPVVLTVHDEIVSEVPAGFGSVAEFESILTELPPWAHGCPVAAEGWRGFRYRK